MNSIVKRFDFGGLSSKVKRTPQGYLKVPASLTRTGVFIYTREDGTKIREYRSPEEVFNKDSLASLAGAPVTDLHPSNDGIPVLVSTKNHKKYSVGIVGESIKQDGKFVNATLTVMDADLIDAIEDGERKEISLGYNCRVDLEAGITPEGEKYDAIQRDITYNHAAIGPKNWGRAGTQVALKLDSGDAIVESHYYNNEQKEVKMENTNVSMKIDGVDYELPKQTAQAFEKALKSSEARIKEETIKVDSIQAELDSVKEELENQKKLHADSNDSEKLNTLVKERLSLVEKARKVLGDEYKFDDKNDSEVIKDVVVKAYPERKLDDKSDDYLVAAFDIAIENHVEHKTDSMEETHKAADEAMKSDSKSTEWNPAEQSRLKKMESSKLWKKPLNQGEV